MTDSIINLRTVEWKNNSVVMIDQTKLPTELVYVTFTDYLGVAKAIKDLVIRGAPAIGVAGAFGLALASLQSKADTKEKLISDLATAKKILFETRPTAINLTWGLEQIMNIAIKGKNTDQIKESIVNTAKKMAEDDIKINMRMGKNGSVLFDNKIGRAHV